MQLRYSFWLTNWSSHFAVHCGALTLAGDLTANTSGFGTLRDGNSSRAHFARLRLAHSQVNSQASPCGGNNFIAIFTLGRKNYSVGLSSRFSFWLGGNVKAHVFNGLREKTIRSLLWHRGCSRLGGATRYQVVYSTDGVSGYQGEEGNRTYQGATGNPTTVAPFILRTPGALPGNRRNRRSHGWAIGVGSVRLRSPPQFSPYLSPKIF